MKAIKFRITAFLSMIPVLMSSLPGGQVYGQSKVKPIQVGERMPDITVNGFLGDPAKTLNFSSLKGKLIILDYWYTSCSACLAGMPEMDSLQNEFGDKIKIILVTKDKEDKVQKLFTRIGMFEKIKHLDVITNDTILSDLFPHDLFPHHTWIDMSGTYRYGTFFYNATRAKIQEVLDGKQAEITQIDIANKLDPDRPIIEQIRGSMTGNMLEYSVLMKGLNRFNYTCGFEVRTDSITNRPYYFHASDFTPLRMLEGAFLNDIYGNDIGIFDLASNQRVIIEVNNPKALYEPRNFDERDKWHQENSITCEVLVKPGKDLFKKVQSVVNEALPYRGVVENRKVTCFALVRTGNTDSLISKGGVPHIESKGPVWRFQNQPMQRLVRFLIKFQSSTPFNKSYPIVDQTNFRGNIDIEFKGSINGYDVADINDQLRKYGLEFVRKELTIPMLIVKDK